MQSVPYFYSQQSTHRPTPGTFRFDSGSGKAQHLRILVSALEKCDTNGFIEKIIRSWNSNVCRLPSLVNFSFTFENAWLSQKRFFSGVWSPPCTCLSYQTVTWQQLNTFRYEKVTTVLKWSADGMWWKRRFSSWMCGQQIYTNCWYRPKALSNVSISKLNRWHKELRQLWR